MLALAELQAEEFLLLSQFEELGQPVPHLEESAQNVHFPQLVFLQLALWQKESHQLVQLILVQFLHEEWRAEDCRQCEFIRQYVPHMQHPSFPHLFLSLGHQ